MSLGVGQASAYDGATLLWRRRGQSSLPLPPGKEQTTRRPRRQTQMTSPPIYGDDVSYEHVGVIDPAHLHQYLQPGSAPTTGDGIPTSSPRSKQCRTIIAAFNHCCILLPPSPSSHLNIPAMNNSTPPLLSLSRFGALAYPCAYPN